MDLRILEIAAHTENNKVVENYTHKSKHKNPLCGDEMEISLIVKEDVVLQQKIVILNPMQNTGCIMVL